MKLSVAKHRNSIKKHEAFLSYTRILDNWHNLVSPKTDRKCPSAAPHMHCFILSFFDFSLLIKAFKSEPYISCERKTLTAIYCIEQLTQNSLGISFLDTST